jgi:hypothetical protein
MWCIRPARALPVDARSPHPPPFSLREKGDQFRSAIAPLPQGEGLGMP